MAAGGGSAPSLIDIISAKRKPTNTVMPVLDVPALIHDADTDDLQLTCPATA